MGRHTSPLKGMLFWPWTNLSLFLLRNDEWISEKPQIPIEKLLIWLNLNRTQFLSQRSESCQPSRHGGKLDVKTNYKLLLYCIHQQTRCIVFYNSIISYLNSIIYFIILIANHQSCKNNAFMTVVEDVNCVMVYSETCLNRTLSKPKTCIIQTDFTVPSFKCLCNLNLSKPSTFLNWKKYSVPKGFGLDRFYCVIYSMLLFMCNCIWNTRVFVLSTLRSLCIRGVTNV